MPRSLGSSRSTLASEEAPLKRRMSQDLRVQNPQLACNPAPQHCPPYQAVQRPVGASAAHHSSQAPLALHSSRQSPFSAVAPFQQLGTQPPAGQDVLLQQMSSVMPSSTVLCHGMGYQCAGDRRPSEVLQVGGGAARYTHACARTDSVAASAAANASGATAPHACASQPDVWGGSGPRSRPQTCMGTHQPPSPAHEGRPPLAPLSSSQPQGLRCTPDAPPPHDAFLHGLHNPPLRAPAPPSHALAWHMYPSDGLQRGGCEMRCDAPFDAHRSPGRAGAAPHAPLARTHSLRQRRLALQPPWVHPAALPAPSHGLHGAPHAAAPSLTASMRSATAPACGLPELQEGCGTQRTCADPHGAPGGIAARGVQPPPRLGGVGGSRGDSAFRSTQLDAPMRTLSDTLQGQLLQPRARGSGCNASFDLEWPDRAAGLMQLTEVRCTAAPPSARARLRALRRLHMHSHLGPLSRHLRTPT
jgi:hypothetical protein